MDARKFLGTYLKKEDIPDSGLVARIRDAKEDTLEEEERTKLILYFDGIDKGLVCNTTNINVIAGIIGTYETEQWKGREIQIYVDHGVVLKGKVVGGIRVRAPGPQIMTGLDPTRVDPQPPTR